MSSTMKCPGCHTPLRVRDDMAGRKIKCPRCARVIAIPVSGEKTPDEVAPDEKITTEPPREKAPREAVASRIEDEEDEEEDISIRRRSKYKPCPRCAEVGAKRVMWTPWGSFYGPALFTHVRCPECGYAYNGKSGRSNLIPAIVFVTIPLLIILAIFGALGWYIHHQGYF